MSDPEDQQCDVRSGRPPRQQEQTEMNMTGDWIFQLKRIGPPASCSKVPDVMRLNLGLTRIGRGQHNDFFLDSAVLKNFISRSHVEIFGKKNENGKIEFVLTDKGLNGTFINDIRTHKTCTLEVGDKITFGHTNGYKIQPGSYAEQPQSEFQFEFQRIPRKTKTSEISEIYSEGLTATTTPHEDITETTPDLKKDTTIVSDRLFLSDIQSNVQTSEKSSKLKSSPQRGRSRNDSSSLSEPEIPSSKNNSETPSSKNNSFSKEKDSVSGKKRLDSASKSPTREVSGSKRKVTRGSIKEVIAETLPVEEKMEVDEEEEEEEEEEEVEEQKEKEKGRKKKKKKGRPSVQKKGGKKKVPDPPSESDESSEEDESSKPEADQKPKAQTNTKPKQNKKKKSGNDAPAIGSRKRRRKAAASSTAPSAEDLEPGVEWYEDDTCDSADCKRPKKKRTPWVQCDDCDGWYHTVCVGANYNEVKDSDEHFNCGCK